MNRIIMLAGALLATTAHAQITLTDLDIAVEKLETEIGKVAAAVAAKPEGRRIAMYTQLIFPHTAKSLTVAGTDSAIEGITHDSTSVTVPAGTYAISMESDNSGYAYLHAGTGRSTYPTRSERVGWVYYLKDTITTARGVVAFATPTRLYLGTREAIADGAGSGIHTRVLLTIEQLD